MSRLPRSDPARGTEAVLDRIPIAVACLDEDARIVWVNPSFEKLFGYTSEEVAGENINELLLPADEIHVGRLLDDEAMEGRTVVREVERRHKDGSLVPTKASGVAVGEGTGGRLLVIYDDISDTVRARTELEARERYHRGLLHALQEDIFVVDRDHKIVDINAAALRTVGYKRDEVVGRHCYEVSHGHAEPCDRHGEACHLEELWRTGVSQNYQHIHKRADGTTFHADILLSPLRDDRGNITMAIEAVRDVTDLLGAQKALHASEQRFGDLVSSMAEGVGLVDENERFLFANPAAENIFGVLPGELVGRTLLEFVDEATAAFLAEQTVVRLVGETTRYDFSIVRGDGVTRFLSATVSPRVGENGEYLGALGTFDDVTDRKLVNDALEESEHKFRAITSSAQDAILMIDDKGAVTLWNEAAERVFGYSAAEIVGRRFHDIVPAQRFRAAHEAAFPEFTKTGHGAAIGQTLEVAALRKDGEEIPVELSLSAVELNGHWNAVGIIRDISDRKRVEAERDVLMEQLEERVLEMRKQAVDLVKARNAAEKAAQAKAAFLANMSHEIRTPIHGVLGTLELVLDDELSAEQRRLVQQAYDSGDALLAIINDVLDFSKIESGHLDIEEITFDPVGLAEAVVRLLVARTVESGVELICDVRPNVPRAVRGDPGRIRQVLTNILGNAVKFTKAGEVVVVLESVDRRNGTVDLAFSVRDTGIGIPPEKLETIFEDFSQADVSTSRKFGGTGLGLAISSRLLGLMGSEMQVTSELGRGSEFRFVLELPIDDASPPEAVGGLDSLRGVRALVVDDNATNRRIVREMLTPAGMVISDVADAETALERLRSASLDGQQYALGIIDVHMPEVDGYQLVERIRADEKLSGMKLMMLTSGGQRGDGLRCRELDVSAYLTKPVSRSELLEVLVRLFGPNAESRSGGLVTRHSIAESRRRLRVLLAEDNIVNQLIAASMLRKRGHEVHVVANGRLAVEAVEKHEFDVVLMDVQMPELDGWGATREIRQILRLESLPIVALTAHAGDNERQACRDAGMDGYLCKPFKPHELFAVVEGWGGDGAVE